MKFTAAVLTGLALLGSTMTQAAAKYPFPRNASYPKGIKAASDYASSSDVQAAYNSFLSRYETGTCGGETCARITFDDPTYTVSEGIGYGMLIMVYMDNATNNTQTKFDNLWKYFKANRNKNGVMNWKIQGFTNSCSGNNCNGASDAELDVALALMMAYKQWGTESYLTDAKTLIEAIYTHEISKTNKGLIKPGDQWEPFYNSSYVSTAALEVFKNASSSNWDEAITANLNMVKANANATSGLASDWCDASGNPVNGNSSIKFGYDAVRTPYRMALSYAWFGHSQAKTVNDMVANWATTKNPIKGNPLQIKDGYNVDGSELGAWNVATYVGALASAGMADAKYQTWVNEASAQLMGAANGSGYYHSSLKVLYGLLLTGNMNNFWSGSVIPTPTIPTYALTTSATNGTIALSPTGGSYDSNSVVTATATANSGYKFTGWSGACTGTGACSITMNSAKSLTAIFALAAVPKYALTTTAVNGTIALSPTGGSYDSNSVVTATATANSGYKFTGWSGACTGTGACSITMNAAKSLTATFAVIHVIPKYTLTTSAGNGSIALSPSGGNYDSNTVVIATATPPTGYVLSGWTGACTGTGACSITMNKDATLGATWALIPPATYALTLTVGAGGKVVRSPDSATYSAGKVVTLTARPDSVSKFSGWTGACSGSDTVCTVTMNEAKTVGANFTAIPFHTLSLNATNGTITTSPAGPKFAEGSTVTLTAVAANGFTFDKWFSSCVTTKGNTCTVVVPGYDGMWVGAGFVTTVGISRRLPNGERLLMSQGILSFDPTGLGTTRLELTDIQGRSQVLWQGQMDGARDIKLQGVKAGVYFVHLQGQSGSFQKLVQILR
jgi:endo-1,4-beta-D-glucanase Y